MAFDHSKIKAICFDIDGTLRNTDDHYVARVARLIGPFRFLLPRKNAMPLARFLVMRLEGPVNATFALADKLGLDGMLHKLVELLGPKAGSDDVNYFSVIPSILPVIQELSKKFPLAIVTTRAEASTLAFLKASHLLPYFSPIATALSTPRGKPKADPILWAANEMRIAAEHCLMVGDTVMDIRAGNAAGAQTLGVLSGFGERRELENSGATLILPSVADMLPIFDQ